MIKSTLIFPEGALAVCLFKEYKRLAKELNNADSLQRAYINGGIIHGLNPFSAVLMNKAAQLEGYQLANQTDLERNIGPKLIGTRNFTGLAVRKSFNKDNYLAENLREQLLAKGVPLDIPAFILLRDLDLANDSSASEGLVFKLKEEAQIYSNQKILTTSGDFSSKEVDLETGLPHLVGAGPRTLYVSDSPLSGVSLSWSLSINADGRRLVPSKTFDEYSGLVLVQKE